MKIAVLSDIHAHWIGFQTVLAHVEAWQPDRVVVTGDHINRGPRPRECLQFLLDKAETAGWLLVRGNHDEYVINHAGPKRPPQGSLAHSFYRATIWTAEQIDNDASALAAMPFQISLNGPDGREVRFVHASMKGTRKGLFVDMDEAKILEKIAPPPPVICVGHTHRAFIRQVADSLVVNVGSAGIPFDFDHRVGYAQLTWHRGAWQAEIIRLPYDIEAAKQDFYDTGYLHDGGPMVELVLDEIHAADSRLAAWANQYEKQVLTGEISMAESVTAFLRSLRE